MIKIVDIDALFEGYISDYVYKNIGKVKPEEIEDNMPVLYEKFGNEKLKELDGKTPNEYYRGFDAETLVNCLKTHVEQKVDVSDFLCEAITSALGAEDALNSALSEDNDEVFMIYVMNMLLEIGATKCCPRLLEIILWDYPEMMRELATEILNENADLVKEQILTQFNDVEDSKKAYLTEILSHAEKDDRIFNILVTEFAKHQKDIPTYANHLAKYGDERAIPFLMNAIEDEKIKYSDFEELRFAIEALGGEYNKERDFSAEKTYKLIKNSRKK
ncbi:MAG: hypothetical protein IJZ73_03620 [Clostridia bacterium]|nr:hypothetical protein [Clostridia bacterium]